MFAAVLTCAPLSAQPEPSPFPETIPLFPLQDIMLFPGVLRPLHIFEPRYREMLLYALANDRMIGMVMLEPGNERDYFGQPPIDAVGCAGVIADIEELPDGRYNIVLHGVTKFRVTNEDGTYAYRVAEVEAIPETLNDDERTALRGHRPRLLEMFSRIAPSDLAPTPDELPDEQLVNGLAQFLRMEPSDRLALLKRDGPLDRAEGLLELLDRGVIAPLP